MRKSRDLEDDKEPGKFSTNLPSIHTHVTHNPFSPPLPPSGESAPESSPFSPVKEKTLDPLESARSLSSASASAGASVGAAASGGGDGGGIKRSISEAMSQAQAQATQQVEECLENTHLTEQGQRLHTLQEKEEPSSGTVTRTSLHPVRTSGLQQPQPQPQSRVGGPLEVESPSVRRTVLAPPGQAPIRGVPGPRVDVEKSPFLSDDEQEKGKQLRTKESWEDFEE